MLESGIFHIHIAIEIVYVVLVVASHPVSCVVANGDAS